MNRCTVPVYSVPYVKRQNRYQKSLKKCQPIKEAPSTRQKKNRIGFPVPRSSTSRICFKGAGDNARIREGMLSSYFPLSIRLWEDFPFMIIHPDFSIVLVIQNDFGQEESKTWDMPVFFCGSESVDILRGRIC